VLFSYSPKTFNLDPKVAMTAVSPIVAGTLPFTPVTYSVLPALPAGLNLNTNTGAISGTPDSGTSQVATPYVVTAKNGVLAFNRNDTLTIAISGVVGILGSGHGLGQHVRIAGRNVDFNAPEATRDLRITISDLRGRNLAQRSIAWPSQASVDLTQSGSATAGLLLVRIECLDANGRVLGMIHRRVATLP
jgi:hypothetical protein